MRNKTMIPLYALSPNKKQRLDNGASQPSSPTTVVTPLGEDDDGDDLKMNEILDPSLQRRVLSFLIQLPSKDGNDSGRQDTVEAIQNCSMVCKSWRMSVKEIVQEPSNRILLPTLVTEVELANIKAGIIRLDLKEIRETFLQTIQERWGHVELKDESTALDVIVERTHGTYESFAKAAEHFYRQFLAVKCVEILVARKHPTASRDDHDGSTKTMVIGPDRKPPPRTVTDIWLEKCLPPKLVHMFWQAHMLHPVKYMQDCLSLINQVIGHHPEYDTMDDYYSVDHDDSTLTAKRQQLFYFEMTIARAPCMVSKAASVGADCQLSGNDIFDLDGNELGTEILSRELESR